MLDIGTQFFGEHVEANMRLDELYLFLHEVDTFLSAAAENLSGKLDQHGVDISHSFAEPLPEILFSSFVASVVSFMERQAQDYAKTLSKAAATPLGMADLSGTWYERFQKFVECLTPLRIGLSKSDWSNLRGLVEVRNCLVHSGGDLTKFGRKQVVEQFLAKHKLQAPKDGYVRADRPLAEVTLSTVRSFIKAIYTAALSQYQK